MISIDKIFIATENLEHTIRELEGLRQRYPNLKWSTLEEALEASKLMLKQRLQLFNITIIAILIGLIIGSQNMMINDIINKRREYAILRTLRVSQGKLINIILTQVVTFCFIGVIIGGTIGVIISNIITICEANYLSFIDLTVLGYVLLTLAVSYILVLIPFALKISRLSIANELR